MKNTLPTIRDIPFQRCSSRFSLSLIILLRSQMQRHATGLMGKPNRWPALFRVTALANIVLAAWQVTNVQLMASAKHHQTATSTGTGDRRVQIQPGSQMHVQNTVTLLIMVRLYHRP